MDLVSLNKIKAFSSNYKGAIINQAEIDFMYRRFSEILLSAIEDFEQKNNRQISQAEYVLLRDSNLSNSNLETLYISAHTHYQYIEQDIKSSVKKEIGSESFGKSVLASMLSNFLYTVVLAIIVFFGKDTVNGLIDSFTEKPQQSEFQEKQINTDNENKKVENNPISDDEKNK